MNLREDKGFSYGAQSSFAFRQGPGPFTASASVETAVTKVLTSVNMPTRDDVTRLAERLTNIELRLDNLEVKLDEARPASRPAAGHALNFSFLWR